MNKSWSFSNGMHLQTIQKWLELSFLPIKGKKTLWRREKILVTRIFSFLAPLAKGQQAIVMALCPLCVRPSMYACIRKLFLQKTSPQKLLTGLLPNFTRMFLRWSSFKFFQIMVYHEEFWLPWQPK